MHDIAHTSRLTAALHQQVADVQPDHRLDEVLDRARHRLPTYLIALAATVGLLLIAAGLLMQAQHRDAPAQPTTHTQEA